MSFSLLGALLFLLLHRRGAVGRRPGGAERHQGQHSPSPPGLLNLHPTTGLWGLGRAGAEPCLGVRGGQEDGRQSPAPHTFPMRLIRQGPGQHGCPHLRRFLRLDFFFFFLPRAGSGARSPSHEGLRRGDKAKQGFKINA